MKRILAFFAAAALVATVAGCHKEVDPTAVTLSQHELTLQVGETATLSATIAPADATNTALNWTSTSKGVATVDQNGRVTALSEGQTSVTVTTLAGGKTDACIVTVTKAFVPVTAVRLDKTSLELTEGDTYTLVATVEPSDATNPAVTFSSSNLSVVSVDGSGIIKALKGGEATVTVKTEDGGLTASCEVKVNALNVDVEVVGVSPSSLELVEGRTAQLKAAVSPSNASQEVEWASMDSRVATVDANGLVTAVAEGYTKVVARSRDYPEKQGVCEVSVIKDPTLKGVAFEVNEITLKIGKTYRLKVIYTPEYAGNKNLTWTSSDSVVASVSDEGDVLGVSEGTATITATSEEGGYTAECKVIVSRTQGVKFYYTLRDEGDKVLYINGEPDPLSGAYDSYERGIFSRVYQMTTDGSHLYTLEYYYANTYPSQRYYVCVDRKPVCELEKDDSYDWVECMAVRNGTVAFVIKRYSDSARYIIRIAPDGTAERCDITGILKVLDNTSCALAPNGDLYVVAMITDSFGDRYFGYYKYTVDGTLTETLIRKNGSSGPLIEISDEGDIYVLDTESSGGFYSVLYKNWERGAVIDRAEDGYFNTALTYSGGHVYTATLSVNYMNGHIVERLDGEVVRTLEAGEGGHFNSVSRPLQVSSSGDIYLSSCNYIFKNDNALYSVPNDDHISHFCIME